jgi:DNA polymerase III alpha subunit
MSEELAYQVVIDENDAVHALLIGSPLNDIVTKDGDWVEKFNHYSSLFDLNNHINYSLPILDENEYISSCVNSWEIPEEYMNLDIDDFLYNKCSTDNQKKRVTEELILFKQKNLLTLLKFMIYFVDTLRKNNILWGVGRGSSVSSYVLFLIGIHRIDSLKYGLKIGEFLK